MQRGHAAGDRVCQRCNCNWIHRTTCALAKVRAAFASSRAAAVPGSYTQIASSGVTGTPFGSTAVQVCMLRDWGHSRARHTAVPTGLVARCRIASAPAAACLDSAHVSNPHMSVVTRWSCSRVRTAGCQKHYLGQHTRGRHSTAHTVTIRDSYQVRHFA